MRVYLAESLGTFWLVLGGYGSALLGAMVYRIIDGQSAAK